MIPENTVHMAGLDHLCVHLNKKGFWKKKVTHRRACIAFIRLYKWARH